MKNNSTCQLVSKYLTIYMTRAHEECSTKIQKIYIHTSQEWTSRSSIYTKIHVENCVKYV